MSATTAPSRTDETAARASGIIGGAWGRHAAAGRWWTPLRVLLAMTCLSLLLGFGVKAPCANAQWSANKQYTHMCYSDVIPLWSDERLDVGAVPYRDTSVEYPVLTGGFMLVTADLTHWVHALDSRWDEVVIFGALTALLLSACGLVTTAATAQAAGSRPYDAAIFALSPLLVLHAFTNWDLLAMCFMSLALWSWARRKPVLAGVFVGLGTAAKLYPVFLFVALFVLAVRTRRYAPVIWSAIAAVGTWAMVNVPIALAYYPGWSEFYRFSIQRAAERSSIWAIMRTVSDGRIGAGDASFWQPPTAAVLLILVGALIGIIWAGLRAPVTPRVAQLAFLAVLAFLLTTKVWSPQYSLWLVPLVALARPRWRITLVWQFTEVAVWILTLTLLLGFEPGQSAHGISYGWLVLVLLVRDALLIAIAALIIYEMWHPELDVVRSAGMDDPAGGVFNGAPDYGGAAAWRGVAGGEPNSHELLDAGASGEA
ncbi:MAG TPA: glycosyltransferase 87 family protein [Jatrophihabitantaceae bacterium]